jgi:hypothetical protein
MNNEKNVDMLDVYSFDRSVPEVDRNDSPGDALIAFTRPLPDSKQDDD